MVKYFSKYVSLIILALFLYPQVQKGLHDFSHRDDFHCPTKTEKHFHEKEHNCSICDHTLPQVTHSITVEFADRLPEYGSLLKATNDRFVTLISFSLSSPRAPPIS